MKIAIIGTGYVGLVSGVCLASKGHDVICLDKNKYIVNSLNAGMPTIHERKLDKLLKSVLEKKRFFATQDFDVALSGASIIMIAVGTPSHNGEIDLTNVLEVTKEIGSYISKKNQYFSIIVKSTVIPSTTDTQVLEVLQKSSNKTLGEFGLGMNPEFLREGNAIDDFMFPDRIVLGFEDQKTLSFLEELYLPWNVDKIKVNSRTAELIKYANNSILATQISTINEIANLANEVEKIDMKEVVKGIHLDKRWNPVLGNSRLNPEILNYLIPGCGFGGSCFTKDLQAIKAQGKRFNLPMSIINAVLDVNNIQPYTIINRLEKETGKLDNKKILILGLTFKPGTDDVRESPSLKIVNGLINKDVEIYAHDPVGIENFKSALGNNSSKIKFIENIKNIIDEIDIIILVTPWDEYFSLSKNDLSSKILFDARGVFDHKKINVKSYLTI